MKYVQEEQLERMESEHVLGWRYSLIWDLESATSFSLSQYYLPLAFAPKYTDLASTGLAWDEQP